MCWQRIFQHFDFLQSACRLVEEAVGQKSVNALDNISTGTYLAPQKLKYLRLTRRPPAIMAVIATAALTAASPSASAIA